MSGIEVLGIVGNIIQVADLGARVALKLCTFCHKVKQAESNIQNLSKDISLTCSVLRQLGDNLQQDEQARLYSQDAFRTAHDILQECDRVFREIELAMNNKDSGSYAADAKAAEMKNPFVKLTRKVNLAFMEPQLGILQTNLDRLKNTMLLMLNVIIYAGQLRKREAEIEKQDQQEMIRLLARQKSDSDRKFDRLSKRLEEFQVYENSESPKNTIYTSPGEETLTARSLPSMSSNSVFYLSAQSSSKAPVVQHGAVLEDQSHLINEEVIKYSELMRAMLESIQNAANVLAPVRHKRIRQSVLHMHREELQNFCDEHGLQAGQLCGLLCNGPLFQSLSSEDPLSVRFSPTRGGVRKSTTEIKHRAPGIPTRGYAGRAGYAHGHGSVFNVNDLLLKWTTLTADELS